MNGKGEVHMFGCCSCFIGRNLYKAQSCWGRGRREESLPKCGVLLLFLFYFFFFPKSESKFIAKAYNPESSEAPSDWWACCGISKEVTMEGADVRTNLGGHLVEETGNTGTKPIFFVKCPLQKP